MPMQKKGRPSKSMAGLNCLFKVRDGGKKACSVHVKFNEKNDGGKKACFVHVKFNEKNDGGKTTQSAHVTMSIRDDGGKKA